MSSHEIDGEVRRLLKARDLEGLWPLVSRRMNAKLKREVRAFVKEELATATLGRLARLYELKPSGLGSQRSSVFAELEERLRHPHHKAGALAAIVELAEKRPSDQSLQGLLLRFDALPVEALRARALLQRGGSYTGQAVFALVRAEEHDWLEAQVRARAFSLVALNTAFDAAQKNSKLADRLVRCARQMRDGVLLRLTLEHFEVAREVLEEALASDDASVRAALMRHAQRLRDATGLVCEGLRHESPDVRRAALVALMDRPIPEALPLVEPLVDDADPYDERYNTEPIGLLARRYLAKVNGTT